MKRARNFHTEIWIKTVNVIQFPLKVFQKKKVEKSHSSQENIFSIAHCIWRLTKKRVSESRTKALREQQSSSFQRIYRCQNPQRAADRKACARYRNGCRNCVRLRLALIKDWLNKEDEHRYLCYWKGRFWQRIEFYFKHI